MADTEEKEEGKTGRAARSKAAAAGVANTVADVILYVGIGIAALLGLSILLFVFDANPFNGIVMFIYETSDTFVGAFQDLFTFDDRKVARLVNYGAAALVYAAVGVVLSRIVRP